MSFLSSDTTEIDQPMELSIFAEPSNQVAVEKVYFTEARPISSIDSEDTPIEIVVSGAGAEYIDLRRSRLYVKAKIIKSDGSDVPASTNIGLANLPLSTIISQTSIYLNNKLVSFNTNNYPWKAYMKTILFSGRDELSSQKQSELFYKDSGNLADPKSVSGGNSGLVIRNGYTKESRIFELEGNLKEDIFDLDKYLINGVDVYLKMFRSSAPFIFMSSEANPSYKLKLLDVVYKVAKVRVDPGVLIQHSKQLETTPVRYPLTRNEVKMNTISTGSTEFYWDNIFPQAIPERVIVGMIKQKAANGDYSSNPFNFEHFNVTDVALSINGESVPGRPLHMDFGPNRNYIQAYVRLFEACGKWNKDAGLCITREDFGAGYTFFAFDITPNFFAEDYINLVRRGNTRLEMKFGVATTEAVNVVLLASFSSLLEINKSRDINYVQQ